MSQRGSNKRAMSSKGVKALIATASVAASIAAWALLPSNDPQSAAVASEPQPTQPSLSVPGTTDTQPQLPDTTQPSSPSSPSTGSDLPQVQLPQGSSSWPRPFTRTHSSR